MNRAPDPPDRKPIDSDSESAEDTRSIWTVPNYLAGIRLVGSPLLLVLAFADQPTVFFWWMLFLLVTDWIDGKLAIALKQRTSFGARLDSVADGAMYAGLLAGMVVLKPNLVRAEWLWLAAAAVSYLISLATGYWRFGRLPSYHTRLAKTSWLLISVAVISIFADLDAVWPLRVALACVTLANLETTLISATTRHWQSDVPTMIHAWKRDRAVTDREAGPTESEQPEDNAETADRSSRGTTTP